MKRVAVLMGGSSPEREVSLTSGRAVAGALREAGYAVREIDVGRDVAALVRALDPAPDAVFNALHGRYGEDGTVQGVLELLGIPYTHSGVLASALAMDKPMAKRLFAAAGIRCPHCVVVYRAAFDAGDPMDRPYVVKPTNQGSSVGVRIVRDGENANPLAEWPFGERVLVERYIAGRELTVAVMGDRPLAVTELRPRSGFYDYDAKYTDGRTDHLVPAPVPEAVRREAMRMALLAHQTLGCRGVSRADFRYDDTDGADGPERLYLLEVNTQPGMTALSLVPEQAAHQGITFPQLVAWMVENARCDG
ncbi:MAG: D-alanine--D-alanine ligase [Rhodospirillaceae bacterium]|nr:D-alanine--D-alanine ligase [Rhodospirillaceae bacterium]